MVKSKKNRQRDPSWLAPFDESDKSLVHAVIETPGGSRNKFKFEPKVGFFWRAGVLPKGMVFPHALGFVPGTKAADGDPEDILIMMDEPTFTGCVVRTRLIGVIEADQTENGQTEQNDRLIAVASNSRDYSEIRNLRDLNSNMIPEIEQFFVNYN
jgi:inorganic pyrophosphatase